MSRKDEITKSIFWKGYRITYENERLEIYDGVTAVKLPRDLAIDLLLFLIEIFMVNP